ncbi:hypothetical protein F9278_28050 [Streptomyces phaeolivaceus]|uniref:Uncharacterized protein n=1 Tax=Streptomyces phaeolivaceus TaxID=2653200 RepID=A0A5P8K809_9ACTN|nr:hypothetical protein [Streptomyces phaeolivaceus]QFQ99365.1 hypothetical protein F9278_28050 [Streptomyces phaeolivaceus]
MDPQLTVMAQTASATVVALMATDVWQHTRDGVVALWQRVRPGQADEVGNELDVTRAEILAARQEGDTLGEQALAGEWQGRLRRLLIADPEIAQELLRVLEESRALLPAEQEVRAPVVNMRAEVSGSGRVYQAGRDQHITER